MSIDKKSGKTVLRSVDGTRAAGICSYSVGRSGIEAAVSAELFSGGHAQAVLQFGPKMEYRCLPAAGIAEPVRCADAGIMAVWVLDDGKPALFGQLVPGAFDRDAARRRLPGGPPYPRDAVKDEPVVKAAAIPAAVAAQPPIVRPSGREPAAKETAVPFPSPGQEDIPAQPVLLLQPGSQPQPDIVQAQAGKARPSAPPAEPQKAAEPQEVNARQPWQPLLVKRAPRPTPRPPVYSPLWDDVSAEFEKMLDSLPKAHPFNGDAQAAEFAEVPTGGAVQCYIGSVTIDGVKVFLQAVPARPYARPAGFDHSLVARDGECYWVKYFIENN